MPARTYEIIEATSVAGLKAIVAPIVAINSEVQVVGGITVYETKTRENSAAGDNYVTTVKFYQVLVYPPGFTP